MTQDRYSFDTGASQAFQGDIQGIVGRLESVMGEREKAVQAAMSDFTADGVSDEYAHVEQRWRTAADEVRSIITLVKTTMSQNDGTAGGALGKAKNAVGGIG